MKKLFILVAFVLSAGLVSAQDANVGKTCAKEGKVCCASKAKASASADTKVASAMSAADIAAEKDENIEKKVCDMTGSVSYFQKTVGDAGTVQMTEVTFDEENSTFISTAEANTTSVKTAEKSAEIGEKKACAKTGKSCCASKKKIGA